MNATCYGLVRSVQPTIEPLTLAEVKKWLRVDSDLTDDDDLIEGLIKASRRLAEDIYDRTLLETTWVLTLSSFPWDGVIRLPQGPLLSVTSVAYRDLNEATQTLAASSYHVLIDRDPGQVVLKSDEIWPSTEIHPQAVTVTYKAGYGTTIAAVPESVRVALRVAVAWWYGRRGDEVEAAPIELPAVASGLLRAYWSGTY